MVVQEKGETLFMGKTASTTMLTLLLTSMLTLAFNIQPVKASGTIYIRADGSIDPPTANITTTDNVTYIFTGNNYEEIVVERSNIIIDGNGYTLQGTEEIAFFLYERSNVTIKSTKIETFRYGVWIDSSSNNKISDCEISGGEYGVYLLDWNCDHNTIAGNKITKKGRGIYVASTSYNNTILGNEITNCQVGVWLESSNNTVSGNSITEPMGGYEYGIRLYASSRNMISGNNIENHQYGIGFYGFARNNTISENNITNNDNGVFFLGFSPSGNSFFHNNFIGNHQQVSRDDPHTINIWDDGYPSGGNYWSDYNGIDADGDGIGDTPYVIDANNTDRYPLMRPWTPEHELAVSIMAPTFIMLGGSSSLEAIVTNLGRNDEVDVEFLLLIDSTVVNSTIIPLLQASNSYMLSYLWTPTIEGTYNVTAYASTVSGEATIQNNQKTKLVIVAVSPPHGSPVGVMAGDWIKVDYTISGWPAGQPYPEWLKVEFLSVEGTSATVRVTMHMSDGTEQNATVPVDVVAGGGEAFGLSGFVIPANLTTGDSVYITGYGNVTIEGEATRTYAGASRTVVYASISQYGTQLTYYWDKQTGVMVEASTTSGGMTATAKATETNMWQAGPSGLPIEPIYLYILAASVIIIVVGATAFIIRRKKKPPEEVENSQSELRLSRTGFRRNSGHRITRV